MLDISQDRDTDFWKFYLTYEQDVVGKSISTPNQFDYYNVLKEFFTVKEVNFTSTLSIPSIDDAVSILDFFYDIEFSKIKQETIIKIKHDLEKQYPVGPVNIHYKHVMYVCSKQTTRN